MEDCPMRVSLQHRHWQQLQTLLAIILLLFSTMIGEEVVGPRGQPIPKKAALKSIQAPRSKQKPLPKAKSPRINQEAFLASFRRQSQPHLKTCLRSWQPSPFEIALSADLEQSGNLQKIRSLQYQLPECARGHMRKMDFSHLTKSLGKKPLTVQWSVSW